MLVNDSAVSNVYGFNLNSVNSLGDASQPTLKELLQTLKDDLAAAQSKINLKTSPQDMQSILDKINADIKQIEDAYGPSQDLSNVKDLVGKMTSQWQANVQLGIIDNAYQAYHNQGDRSQAVIDILKNSGFFPDITDWSGAQYVQIEKDYSVGSPSHADVFNQANVAFQNSFNDLNIDVMNWFNRS